VTTQPVIKAVGLTKVFRDFWRRARVRAVSDLDLDIQPGETTADGKYQLERVACLGCCALAPVVTIDEKIYGQTSVLRLQGILEERENREGA